MDTSAKKGKKGYSNLFSALKARDYFWRKHGTALRPYEERGRCYLSSLSEAEYHRHIHKYRSARECTEENLIAFLYDSYKNKGYFPTFNEASTFFDASDELMEAFVSDCSVVMVGTALVPLSEIEENYKIHFLKEEVELVIKDFSLDTTTFDGLDVEEQWAPIEEPIQIKKEITKMNLYKRLFPDEEEAESYKNIIGFWWNGKNITPYYFNPDFIFYMVTK